MGDLRALANFRNLDSYRAWKKEGFSRSGFNWFVLIAALSTPFFCSAAAVMGQVEKADPGALVRLMSAALAVYVASVGGLMLVFGLRLGAWKRAHPWEPPPPLSPWARGLPSQR